MAYTKYSKEESKEEIKRLVDQFDTEFGGKKNPQKKEAQVEDKYIKPLFSYLNWNIHNEGLNSRREEFRVQTSHKIKKTVKQPDYELWLPDKETNKMKRHFFMEAKDPKYDLQKEVKYMRQAYQYAHSTLSLSDHSFNRTRLSLLTDFEEFRLFDCFDPHPLTKNEAKLYNKYIVKPFDYNYQDYIKEFDNIWNAFERDNVFNGSLSEFQVTDDEIKKNRIAPDLRFLDDLKKWRLDFARSMYKSNKDVTDDFLTAASQVMINRIIFLKMLTDKEIEKDYLTEILNKIKKEKSELSIYDSCRDIFEELDKRYNGDIFKKREEFDYVQIENKIFTDIIDSLRPEKSVYSLSAMPVEIIGNAYEQFLGEVIVHKGRGLTSEQKPEVQKAGGVYYTPKYVVDYIIENTLGEKLKKCKNPSDVKKLKILDPACGSGSFLIGAYDYLIEWHIFYYKKQIDKMLNESKSESKSESEIKKKYKYEFKYYSITDEKKKSYIIHLTSKLKKEILLNNIYGVDIDANAVEITRFSLSMKALDNSNREELYEDVDLFNEQLLPKLESNIKSGNSLISFDYRNDRLKFDEKKVNMFDWQKQFSSIMKNDGFDCIIGNPPYIRSKLLEPEQREYFTEKFKTAGGTYDIYILFIEKGLSLLNEKGSLGYINQNKYFYSDYGNRIRELISNNYFIQKIVDFNEFQVFKGITTYTAINIFSRKKIDSFEYTVITDKKTSENIVSSLINNNIEHSSIQHKKVKYSTLKSEGWIFEDYKLNSLINKLFESGQPLENYCYKIYQGFVLTPTEVFPVRIEQEYDDYYSIKPVKKDENEYKIEKNRVIPLLKSSDIKKYSYNYTNYNIVFPYEYDEVNNVKLIDKNELKKQFPYTLQYFEEKKEYLITREKGKWKNSPYWYEFSRKQNFECQKMKKILVPGLATEARYAIGEENIFIDQGSYGIILNEKYKEYYHYFLGILNSKTIDFCLKSISGTLSGGYYSYQTKYLNRLPILDPFTMDNSIVEKISSLVIDIIDNTIKYNNAKLESDKNLYMNIIDNINDEIEKVILEIYNVGEFINYI